MGIVPFLPSIIVLLLIVSTITLFIFWLGQPSRKKLTMARLSLGYLFILNALLAITTNVMVFKDPASVEKSPLSLLMMLLPLGVGVLLYRGGCKRQAEIPAQEAEGKASSSSSRRARSYKSLNSRKTEKQSQWKIIDENAAPQGRKSSFETWVMVLFLVSALAYAPAMFMLETKEDSALSSQPPSSAETPNPVTHSLPVESLQEPLSPADSSQGQESHTGAVPANQGDATPES